MLKVSTFKIKGKAKTLLFCPSLNQTEIDFHCTLKSIETLQIFPNSRPIALVLCPKVIRSEIR